MVHAGRVGSGACWESERRCMMGEWEGRLWPPWGARCHAACSVARKDTKTLFLRNSTLLPVAWHLTALETLGDDFSVSHESGVIDPKSEYPLHVYFRALKPVTTTKKVIKLEVIAGLPLPLHLQSQVPTARRATGSERSRSDITSIGAH